MADSLCETKTVIVTAGYKRNGTNCWIVKMEFYNMSLQKNIGTYTCTGITEQGLR